MTKNLIARWLPLFAGMTFLVGCGGGGGASHAGSDSRAAVRFSIAWPERARTASAEANSVVVTLTEGGAQVGHAVINRPQNSDTASEGVYTFGNVAAGSLTTSATAFTGADSSGDMLSTGESTTVVRAGTTLLLAAAPPTSDQGLTIAPAGTQDGTGQITIGIH